MISPTSPVGHSLAGSSLSGLNPAGAIATQPASLPAVSQPAIAEAAPALAAATLFAAVSELLDSIGGGLENDTLLETLIVLFILLSLMQNRPVSDAAQGQLANGFERNLATATGSGETVYWAASYEVYHSRTILISVGAAQPPASFGDGSQGSSLDIVA